MYPYPGYILQPSSSSQRRYQLWIGCRQWVRRLPSPPEPDQDQVQPDPIRGHEASRGSDRHRGQSGGTPGASTSAGTDGKGTTSQGGRGLQTQPGAEWEALRSKSAGWDAYTTSTATGGAATYSGTAAAAGLCASKATLGRVPCVSGGTGEEHLLVWEVSPSLLWGLLQANGPLPLV